jgi:general secretion pathway protein K
MTGPGRARGVALVTALLAVALAVVLLAILLDAIETGSARSATVARGLQADAYARGLERWALEILRRDAAFDEGRDSFAEAWATGLPPTPVEGGVISGRLIDQGGCFNVNNLVAGGVEVGYQRARFERLLTVLRLDPSIAGAVIDWIDPDGVPVPRGAEDAVYAARNPPYRAANRPLAHASELRAVAGIDDETWRRLAPHVCALPPPTPLNVNTATVPVLMALDARAPRGARGTGRLAFNRRVPPRARWRRRGLAGPHRSWCRDHALRRGRRDRARRHPVHPQHTARTRPRTPARPRGRAGQRPLVTSPGAGRDRTLGERASRPGSLHSQLRSATRRCLTP